uniref:Peptidase S1 domain-containing protein n=1 Tax=Musca domestica TaxID=7370 RepID=A0A1I8MXH9_MUSDO
MNAYQRHWQIVLPWTFLLLTSPVLGANSTPQGFSSTSVLRQNNFFEWLLSIFQTIPPFSVIPTTGRPPTTAPVTTDPSACAACKCGAANSIRRIVGGYETQVNQYPWMAMLLFRGHFYCGASLISDRYVVTAAHCLRSFPRPFVSVRLMAHNLKDRTVRVIDRRADKVVVHPKYSMSNNDNDIGLVKLDQVVEMSSVMRPVCLAMSERSYDDELAVITGWGVTSEGGQVSQTLREVKVPILSQMACHATKYGKDRITENMLCAGAAEGGLDACQGDSGGPLMVSNGDLNTFHLAGVVSWGEGCAREDYPGVYTRVSQYLEWIEENTNDSCGCEVPSQRIDQVEILENEFTFIKSAT